MESVETAWTAYADQQGQVIADEIPQSKMEQLVKWRDDTEREMLAIAKKHGIQLSTNARPNQTMHASDVATRKKRKIR
jgi:hypothetical protein